MCGINNGLDKTHCSRLDLSRNYGHFHNWICAGLGIFIALPFLLAAVFLGGMGGGDIKLMAACGLVLGLPKGLLAAMAGLSLLLIYVVIYRIVCKVQRGEAKKAFPLAPFLSAGCLLAYFIS